MPMSRLPAIERFVTASGITLYRMPVEAFPGNFIVYCYLVVGAGVPTLIDCGSGLGESNQDLIDALAAVRETFSEPAADAIQRILVTHGHIDHFGGLSFMYQRLGGVPVGVHDLDRRVLTAYDERVTLATKDLAVYLERAGVKPSLRQTVLDMYGFAKKHYASVPVSIALDDDLVIDGMRVIHTPGHCSGQVCILIDDVLISADHVLARITPHQAPESITHYTGLGHYLDALKKIQRVDGVRLALGGHEQPIHDLYTRVDEIRASHLRKLERVSDAIRGADHPLTISDISKIVYPDKHGYDILLALEEIGAHVEYLYEHGRLALSNVDEVEREDNPAWLYTLI
jgi:glyoxylase-like metal-dependent hydrolase (beta-lactamase superfamily II)